MVAPNSVSVQRTVIPEYVFFLAVANEARDSFLSRTVGKTAREIGRFFRNQGKALVEGFADLRYRFDRNADHVARNGLSLPFVISDNDWETIYHRVTNTPGLGSRETLGNILVNTRSLSYLEGGRTSGKGIDLVKLLGLRQDDALIYARANAAAQVTRIDEGTRNELRKIITKAIEKGTPWKEVSDQISTRFVQFAGDGTKRSRADVIASFEIRDAFEEGQFRQVERLTEVGLEFEKLWGSAGDGRVRPAHRENEAAGFIPFRQPFPDGAIRPPTDGGCRCSVFYRLVSEGGGRG